MRKPSASEATRPSDSSWRSTCGKIADRHIEVAGHGPGREFLGDDTGVASLVGVQPRKGGEERGNALSGIAASALDGPRAHEIELAVAGGSKARGELPVRLEKLLELGFADRADDRLGDGLRGARVHGQVSEADDVAGKGELDDFVMTVVPTHVMAQGAALDAVEPVAVVSRVK